MSRLWHTDARTCESRAVFCWGRIRNITLNFKRFQLVTSMSPKWRGPPTWGHLAAVARKEVPYLNTATSRPSTWMWIFLLLCLHICHMSHGTNRIQNFCQSTKRSFSWVGWDSRFSTPCPGWSMIMIMTTMMTSTTMRTSRPQQELLSVPLHQVPTSLSVCQPFP